MISIQEKQQQIMTYLNDSCGEHLEMYAEGDRIQRILFMAAKMVVHEQEMCNHYKQRADIYKKRADEMQRQTKEIIWD